MRQMVYFEQPGCVIIHFRFPAFIEIEMLVINFMVFVVIDKIQRTFANTKHRRYTFNNTFLSWESFGAVIKRVL